MQASKKAISETQVELTIELAASELNEARLDALSKLRPEVSAPGFRKGKVPLVVVERQVDENYLQSQIIESAVNRSYIQAVAQEHIQPVDKPVITVTKFVSGEHLLFTAAVEVIPNIKLADYKKIRRTIPKVQVTEKDIHDTLENLQRRSAKRTEVQRAAKINDEVLMDFDGKDEQGRPVAGAAGKDYPLWLGSKTFIPGFEEQLVGLKKSETKTFKITFPKDYAHKPLSSRRVAFTVYVKKVSSVSLPKLDEKFIKKLGPFKDLDELKDDIKAQLSAQKQKEAKDKLKDSIIEEVVKKSNVPAPKILINDQIRHLEDDWRQNLLYRGISMADYLRQLGKSEEDYKRDVLEPKAQRRVQVGLILNEIAEKEQLRVSDDELNARLNLLKNQYRHAEAQAELSSPEARRDIANRIMTEKVVDKLVDYATK